MTDPPPSDLTICRVAAEPTGRLAALGVAKIKTGYTSSAFGLVAFVTTACVVEVLWRGTSALLPFAMTLAPVYIAGGAWIKSKASQV